jgi:hypothetical protein
MVRPFNRKRHEFVDDLKDPRSCMQMTGGDSRIEIHGEHDLMPPWTAEFWLWRVTTEEDAKVGSEVERR